MKLVQVRLVRLGVLFHLDRPADDHIQRVPIRQHAVVVIENASRVEKRHGESEEFLDSHLDLVDGRVGVRMHLFVEVVFAERQDGHEIGAGADGQLDEPLAPFEDEAQRAWLCVQRLPGPAHDDSDCTTHPFAVGAATGEKVFTRLAGYGGKAHCEGVVAVEGDAEVGIEGEQSVCDAGEELREAESFRCEGNEGTMADYSMRVVAENIFAGRGQRSGAVQAGGEVGGEEGPDAKAADELGTVREVARGAGAGEEDIDCIGEKEGPEEGD